MILDRVELAGRFEPLGSGIALGLAYLRSFDLSTVDGRYPLDGEDLFAIVQTYGTGPATARRFEAHREYVDIQYVVSGRERILHAYVGDLEVEVEYCADTDVELFADPPASSSFLLDPGRFAILFPGDAHKPGCMAGGRSVVRKVVVKVRL